MNITRILILSVPVKDQQAAKAFYVEKLGFAVLRDDAFGNQRWIQVGPAGAQTSITLVTDGVGMQPGSQQGIVLETKDVQADYEALKAKGVAVTALESAPWGKYTTFTDPDGNGWVLQQSAF